MIDYKNAKFIKLRKVEKNSYSKEVDQMLIDNEIIIDAFKGIRDGIVITNKRIIVINIQGMTGKKKDLTSLPFSKIQSYSIETIGVVDIESELILWFSGIGAIRLEFTGATNLYEISRAISTVVLN